MFNLNVYPIHTQEGKPVKSLPGLVAFSPPRKCARGREADQFLGLIQLSGQTSITAEALHDWLLSKSAVFYKTPGTVTSAMRFVAESINSDLLDRNLKRAKDGSQVNGSLSLVVIRRNTVYTVIIGQAHIFVLSGKNVFEFDDRENHPRGLGVAENIVCRFSQTEITENDAILIAPQANRAWSVDSLNGGASLSTEALARRIYNQAPPNLTGALLRLIPGNGQVFYHFLQQNGIETGPVTPIQSEIHQPDTISEDTFNGSQPEEQDLIENEISAPDLAVVPVETVHTEAPASERLHEPPISSESRSTATRETISRPQHTHKPDQREPREPAVTSDEIKAQVGSYVKAIDHFQSKTRVGFNKLLGRLLPGSNGEFSTIPRSVMLITAIAIPIFVLALASWIYFSKGKSQKFELYFLQGQQYAAQAATLSDDPAARLASLQQALYYLEQASEFGQTNDSNALRTQIQNELDSMQGVVRLNVSPISSIGFSGEVSVTQMAATSTDLYLLDQNSGRALRFYLSGSEYVQDTAFDCGPNPSNPLNSINNLVDIVPLSAGSSFNATLLAIDSIGNIEFCNPGDSGVVGTLMPPDAGWRGIRSIAVYQNYLFVLDPEMNAVYRFEEVENAFGEKPSLYFDDIVPNLATALDIEVNGDELYILRSTGEMVECTYSHIKDYKLTECTDPAPYGDMRTGESPQAISFPNSQFIQMRMTAAPDSSIYLLDANGQNLYHFSLQRNLQKILHPGFSDPGFNPESPLTAVAVSPGKTVFLAYGDQIFHGTLP